MGKPQDFCRFCLTTDEDRRFNVIDEGDNIIVKNVWEAFRVKIWEFPILVCSTCERDMEQVMKTYGRILDVQDYVNFNAGENRSLEESIDFTQVSGKSFEEQNHKASDKIKVQGKVKNVAKTASKSSAELKKRKIIFECDSCKTTFDSLADLNTHIIDSCLIPELRS